MEATWIFKLINVLGGNEIIYASGSSQMKAREKAIQQWDYYPTEVICIGMVPDTSWF